MIKKIYHLVLGSLLLISCGDKLSGQEILNSLSKEMCNCIKSNNYKNSAEIGPCYDELFANNMKAIREYYDSKELSEYQIEEFRNKIAVKTLENCKYIKNHFPTGIVGEKRTRQTNINCSDLKNGDFFYLTQRPDSKIKDTTFVTISGDTYLEKMRNQTTYSELKINWTNECEYELIFEKSNDPFKKERFKAGDLFKYEIIANENTSFFVEMDWEGTVLQFQISTDALKFNR